jgi:hypothetical protein
VHFLRSPFVAFLHLLSDAAREFSFIVGGAAKVSCARRYLVMELAIYTLHAALYSLVQSLYVMHRAVSSLTNCVEQAEILLVAFARGGVKFQGAPCFSFKMQQRNSS